MTDKETNDLLNRLKALKPNTGISVHHSSGPNISLSNSLQPKGPTSREDALSARLKSLRNSSTSPVSSPSSCQAPASSKPLLASRPAYLDEPEDKYDEDLCELLDTNDDLMAELLDENPDDLLGVKKNPVENGPPRDDSDDSDGEAMKKKIEDALSQELSGVEYGDSGDEDGALALPSVPSAAPVPHSPQGSDALAARFSGMAIPLSLPQRPTDAETDALGLPSVPTGKPTSFKRLASKTNYTDEDAGTWCTVCLEDATLKCLNCDAKDNSDLYCSRCWNEMHRGPMAGFDETTHKAVRFVRPQKQKKVAIGAS